MTVVSKRIHSRLCGITTLSHADPTPRAVKLGVPRPLKVGNAALKVSQIWGIWILSAPPIAFISNSLEKLNYSCSWSLLALNEV